MVMKQVGIKRKQNETRKKCDMTDKPESLARMQQKRTLNSL